MKPKMIYRYLFLLIIFSLLAYFSVHFLQQLRPTEPQPIPLKKQTSMQNFFKIDVSPVFIRKNNRISFFIELESYQNQKLLDLDLTAMALLKQEDQTIQPALWKPKTVSQYHRSGILVFDLPPNVNTATITLIIFALEQRTFEWHLNLSNMTTPQ